MEGLKKKKGGGVYIGSRSFAMERRKLGPSSSTRAVGPIFSRTSSANDLSKVAISAADRRS